MNGQFSKGGQERLWGRDDPVRDWRIQTFSFQNCFLSLIQR